MSVDSTRLCLHDLNVRIDSFPTAAWDETRRRIMDLESRVTTLEESLRHHDGVADRKCADCCRQSSQKYTRTMSTVPAKHDGDFGDCTSHLCDSSSEASSPEARGIEVQDETGGHVHVNLENDCHLAESIWDAALLVGLPGIGRPASIVLMFHTILNVTIQISMCLILLFSDDFVPSSWSRYDESFINDMRRWRLTSGHALSELDHSGASLVSRVCANEGALSVGVFQKQILWEINGYFGMTDSVSEVTGWNLAKGPLVAIMCLFYFSLVVLTDLRAVSRLVFALAALPRGPHTLFENNTLLSISFQRLTLTLLIMFLRVCVALSLLLAGMIWLAVTNAMTDLILNTAALSFVLSLDDWLFQAMLPSTVLRIAKGMKPLKYRRARWNLEAVLPFIFACFTIGAVYQTIMVANIDGMQNVRQELCQGNTEFVAAKNALGVMIGRKTRKVAENTVMDGYESQAVLEAIQDNVGRKGGSELLNWYENILAFEDALKYTVVSVSGRSPCQDRPLPREVFGRYERTLAAVLAQKSGRLASHEFDCSHHLPVCDNATYPVMRLICPEVCGCNNWTSGLLFSGESIFGGCPRSCKGQIQEQIENVACLDLPVASRASEDRAVRLSWKRYWESAQRFIDSLSAIPRNFSDFVATRIAIGCKNLSTDLSTAIDFCSTEKGFLRKFGLQSIMAFCPDACCRRLDGTRLTRECPPACSS